MPRRRFTRHSFGAISKYSGAALNTRAPLVPTTVVEAIDRCDVRALAQRYGSPLFVVSESRLRAEFRALRDAFRHLVLPAVALATIPLAIIARITRAAVLDAPDGHIVHESYNDWLIDQREARKRAGLWSDADAPQRFPLGHPMEEEIAGYRFARHVSNGVN